MTGRSNRIALFLVVLLVSSLTGFVVDPAWACGCGAMVSDQAVSGVRSLGEQRLGPFIVASLDATGVRRISP